MILDNHYVAGDGALKDHDAQYSRQAEALNDLFANIRSKVDLEEGELLDP